MIEKIKELRNKTNLSLNDCRSALTKADGDLDKALELLTGMQARKRDKRLGNETKEGRIEVYIHPGSQLAAMVEVNCETDFAARSQEFIKFCETIAMQVVALEPKYINKAEISADEPEQRELIANIHKGLLDGKPDAVRQNIIDGKISNWYREQVLLEQSSVTEDGKTIQDLLTLLSAQLGENVVITRFIRWQVR